MKYVVCGICKSAGVVVTRQIEAPDPLAAEAIAARTMVVFEVERQDTGEPRNAASPSVAAPAAMGDSARRVAFVFSILILAAVLLWSAQQKPTDHRQANSAVHPAVVLTTQLAVRTATLPQVARTTALPLVPGHVALTH